MNVRLWLVLTAAAAVLGACAGAMGPAPTVMPEPALSANEPLGHSIDEVMASNGPPSQQWDLPDGRRAWRWESSSVTARVGPGPKGEVRGAATQTTCYYTLYTRADAKGVVKVVAADEPTPGCMKLAMNGQAH